MSTKSKLCGNVACEGELTNFLLLPAKALFPEVLFKSRVKRVMGINNDPSFLNLAENSIISVVAVKFSDRPDIMEGRVSFSINFRRELGFFSSMTPVRSVSSMQELSIRCRTPNS